MTIEERFEEAEDLFYDDEYEKAFPLLQALSNVGHAQAQYLLGECYYSGDGIDQDYNKAAEWFRKSADQGDADGQFSLALCYESGNGVEEDIHKAIELYEKAAAGGNKTAAKRMAEFRGESSSNDESKNTEDKMKLPVFSIAGAAILALIGALIFGIVGLILGAGAGWFAGSFAAKKLGK
jgi:TPR repeat protein